MKKLISSIFIICLAWLGYSQNLGVRVNSALSSEKRSNQIYGGGVFLNLNDYSDNIELVLSADIIRGKKNINSDSVRSDHQNFQMAIAALYPISLTKSLDFKMGTKLSYINTFTMDQKNGSTLVNYYQSRYFGAGIIFDLQYQGIFSSRLNLDLFISPDYIVNAKNSFSPSAFISEYSTKNTFLLNFQFGLSYKLVAK